MRKKIPALSNIFITALKNNYEDTKFSTIGYKILHDILRKDLDDILNKYQYKSQIYFRNEKGEEKLYIYGPTKNFLIFSIKYKKKSYYEIDIDTINVVQENYDINNLNELYIIIEDIIKANNDIIMKERTNFLMELSKDFITLKKFKELYDKYRKLNYSTRSLLEGEE